jgi:hypothetical protein
MSLFEGHRRVEQNLNMPVLQGDALPSSRTDLSLPWILAPGGSHFAFVILAFDHTGEMKLGWHSVYMFYVTDGRKPGTGTRCSLTSCPPPAPCPKDEGVCPFLTFLLSIPESHCLPRHSPPAPCTVITWDVSAPSPTASSQSSSCLSFDARRAQPGRPESTPSKYLCSWEGLWLLCATRHPGAWRSMMQTQHPGLQPYVEGRVCTQSLKTWALVRAPQQSELNEYPMPGTRCVEVQHKSEKPSELG